MTNKQQGGARTHIGQMGGHDLDRMNTDGPVPVPNQQLTSGQHDDHDEDERLHIHGDEGPVHK